MAGRRVTGPRYSTGEGLLRLALALQATRAGMTLVEMGEHLREAGRPASRRTVERMRDAIHRLCPGFEVLDAAQRPLRYRIQQRSTSLAALEAVTAETLTTLKVAAKVLQRDNLSAHAQTLDRLARKLAAEMPQVRQRRVEPDLELLAAAEGLVHRVGPRVNVAEAVMAGLREAILSCRRIEIRYRSRGTGKTSTQEIEPYAFVYGHRPYLLARNVSLNKFSYWSLSNITEAPRLLTPFRRRKNFSLARYLDQSFGVFQEEPVNVVWRFHADVADEAGDFQFHPTQRQRRLRDGRLEVRFRAGGLREMAWHLATWGGKVEVLAPKELKVLVPGA